jgi:hypothetical protein
MLDLTSLPSPMKHTISLRLRAIAAHQTRNTCCMQEAIRFVKVSDLDPGMRWCVITRVPFVANTLEEVRSHDGTTPEER